MITWKRCAVLAAALVLTAGLWACAKDDQGPSSSLSSSVQEDATLFVKGTSVGGLDISGKTAEEALRICKAAVDSAVNSLEITVKFKDATVSLGQGDFQATDILELSLPRLLASRKGGDHPLSYVTDLSAAGRKKLEDAAAACFVQGKDAAVASFDTEKEAFVFQDEQPGTRADLAATLKSVRQLLAQKHGGAIQAAFLETKPKVTKKYLSENFKLLSSYTTESTNTSNGNSNMALALSHINGTILQPGQLFSYNSTIGDSTDPDAGWLTAGGLVSGLLVQVYGGGICQGSTTLYNAALLAGMEIVERECHSSPSSYCPLGLDATVDYGNIDFQFRNALEAPVYIAAWMEDVILHVNFYGCFPKEWDKITVGSEQTGYEPPLSEVRFREDSNLSKGQYVRVAYGESGYSARAWRTYYKGDKEVKTEDLPNSYYDPSGPTYSIGPGTDTSKVDTSKDVGSTLPSPSPSPAPSQEPSPSPSQDPASSQPEEPTPEPPFSEPPVSSLPDPEPPELDPSPDSGDSSLVEW